MFPSKKIHTKGDTRRYRIFVEPEAYPWNDDQHEWRYVELKFLANIQIKLN